MGAELGRVDYPQAMEKPEPARVGTLQRAVQAIDRVSTSIGKLAGWLCLLMVTIGAGNAVARYLGKFIKVDLSSNRYLEMQWYLFSMVFLLGAAATLQRNEHVRVDVLYGRLSKRKKAWIDFFGAIFFLLPFCVFGTVTSWDYVLNSWHELEASPDPGGLPRYPIKSFLIIGFVLLGIQSLSFAGRSLLVLRDQKEAG